MAEFVGGEPISVGVDEPITFENKIDTDFDVGYGIVFRKSGLYRVTVVGKHTSVEIEPERKKGKWIFKKTFPNDESEFPMGYLVCSECGSHHSNKTPCNFCDNCGADMKEGAEEE